MMERLKTRGRVVRGASILMLAAGLAAAVEPAGLVLHFPFDGTIEPMAGQGIGLSRMDGKPEFVEGRSGQALSLTDGASLTVPLPAAIKEGEFSISLWLKPMWHPNDNLPHPILEIADKPEKQDAVGWAPGQLLVSKGWSETIAPNYFYGVVDSDTVKRHLKPGQWAHLVVVFSVSGKFTGSYIDGEGYRQPQNAVKSLEGHGDVMWLGSRAGGQTCGEIVVDDLKIYNRAITPEEIPAIAGATFPPPRDYLSLGNACDPANAVETPHVTWAKPLAGGPLKVLCVTEGRRSREIIELMQRLDITPIVATVPTESPDILKNPELFQTLGRKIEETITAGKLDCILFGAIGWNLLPDTTRAAVLTYLKAGGGVVFVDPRCLSVGPGPGIYRNLGGGMWLGWADTPAGQEIESLTGRLERVDEDFLIHAIPWPELGAFANTLKNRPLSSLFRGGRVDQGRVLIYDIHTGGSLSAGFLTPFSNQPADFDPLEYDYIVGAAARAVLWAAQRDSPVRIQGVSYLDSRGIAPEIQLGANGVWRLDLLNRNAEPCPAQVVITVRGRNPDAPCEVIRDVTLKSGVTRVDLPVPMAAVGVLFGDVRLKLDGKVADWATGTVRIESGNPSFLSFTADRAGYEPGETPQVTARTGLARYAWVPGEQGEIRWRLYDSFGRLILRSSQPVHFAADDETPAMTAWCLPALPSGNLAYSLLADLVYKDKVTDQRRLDLYCRNSAADDFLFTSWQGGGHPVVCLATLVMRDRYQLDCGGFCPYGRPLEKPRLEKNLGWLARQNLRPWIYSTHLGGGLNADKIRMPDLADPDYLRQLRERLQDIAEIAKPYSILFYSLGDETSLGPPDARATGYEQEEFRRYLKGKYVTIETLDQAWDATFKSWTEIVIPAPEELTQGKGGPAAAELQPFREGLYARAITVGTEGALAADPTARVGVEGVFGLTHAGTGQDYWKMTRGGTFQGQYALGMELNMVRSFQKPGDLLAGWYNYAKLDREYSLFGPWHMLLRGAKNFMWYTTFEGSVYTALNPDFSAYEQFNWTWEELEPLLNGIGKLVVGLERDNLGVAVLYDQRNLNRVTPNFHATLMTAMILDDLGIQHSFIHGDQIMAGAVTPDKVKLLLLPGQFCMNPDVAEAIRNYVLAGGTLLADAMPAEGNGLKRYEKPLLADVFAAPATFKTPLPPECVEDAKAWKTHLKTIGQGQTLFCANYPAAYGRERYREKGAWWRDVLGQFLAGVGVTPEVTVKAVDGSFQPLTLVTYRDGDAVYAGLQREYAVADPGPREFELICPIPAQVYDVRTGTWLGETDRVRMKLDVARGALLAFLPYRAGAVRIENLPATVKAGAQVQVGFSLESTGGRPGQGVFRLEILNPAGQPVTAFRRKLRWNHGRTACELVTASNDPPGTWTLQVTDVATGACGKQAFDLK